MQWVGGEAAWRLPLAGHLFVGIKDAPPAVRQVVAALYFQSFDGA